MKITCKMVLPTIIAVAFLVGGTFAAVKAAESSGEMRGQEQDAYMGCNPCWNGKGMQMSEEQRAKVNALLQESEAKVEPLRDQLFVKREELRALQNAATPDMKAVNSKAMEINGLREQLRKERAELGKKIDTALGLKPGTHGFMGRMGNPMGGHGMGNKGGNGMNRGAY